MPRRYRVCRSMRFAGAGCLEPGEVIEAADLTAIVDPAERHAFRRILAAEPNRLLFRWAGGWRTARIGADLALAEAPAPKAGALCGALLLPPDERAEPWRQVLALPNPDYLAWTRHGRGLTPPRTVAPVWVQDGGPWKGGPMVPRRAPGARGVDRRAYPEATPLDFRWALRPYQERAVEAAMEADGGIVVAPCGAGKTVIGCAIIARHPTPALILVHTRDLAEQWAQRIAEALGERAAIIGYGRPPAPPARITIASLQTLARRTWWAVHQDARRFGLVICDEAHHMPARGFGRVLCALPARARYGLTATPERADGLTPWLHWHLGPVCAQVGQADLQEAGAILTPEIRWVQTPAGTSYDGMEPHERDRAIATDDNRNRLILDHAAALRWDGHRVLVLVRLVLHARRLAEALQAEGLTALALVGALSAEDRAAAVEGLRSGSVDVVIATSLADEGLDAPRLDAVILATPTGNLGRVEQRIGRALRPHPESLSPVVVDLVDDWGPFRGYANRRRRLYSEKGWA